MSLATATWYFDTRREKKGKLKGLYPIKLTVYFNGKKARYRTPFNFKIEQWDKINSPKLRDEELKEEKKKVDMLLTEANEIIKSLNPFSFRKFEDKLYGETTPESELKLSSLFDEVIKDLKNHDRIGTADSYQIARNSLFKFKPSVLVNEINSAFLNNYEAYLKTKNNSDSTIGIYMRSLRVIINIAINRGIIDMNDYPFKKYKIPTRKKAKKALSSEELKKIANFRSENPTVEKYRDFWLFSFYCNGANFADICNLRYSDINKDKIQFYRQKTLFTTRKNPRLITAGISPKMKEIIEKYGNKKKPDNYIFPILEPDMTLVEKKKRINTFNSHIRKYMQVIANELKIDHSLSSMTARHSWGTSMQRLGAPKEFLQTGYGHGDSRTTENYIGNYEDETIDKYSNLLTDLLNPK